MYMKFQSLKENRGMGKMFEEIIKEKNSNWIKIINL